MAIAAVPESDPTRCCPSSAPAAWARSIGPVTRRSTAMSPSRCADLFASDPERLARFTREAQTLAALDPPNIAPIHGLEDNGGVRALVMELVEGEDLSQRLGATRCRSTRPCPSPGRLRRRSKPRTSRDCPPRSQAREHQGARRRRREGAGLRAGEGAGAGGRAARGPKPRELADDHVAGDDHARDDPRHRGLHGPEQAKGKPADKRGTSGRSAACSTRCSPAAGPSGRRHLRHAGGRPVEGARVERLAGLDAGRAPRLLTRCLTKDPKARLRDIGEARVPDRRTLGGPWTKRVRPPSPARSGWRRLVRGRLRACSRSIDAGCAPRRLAVGRRGDVHAVPVSPPSRRRRTRRLAVLPTEGPGARPRSRCHPMAGTSRSSLELKPRTDLPAPGFQPCRPGDSRDRRRGRSRSGRRTAALSGSSQMAS